jgi:molybdopterin biosynthesis enzyme
MGLYRARLDGNVAHPLAQQASGAAHSLAQADVVVVVPDDSQGLAAGASAQAILLPRP